jgi:hypothetical protein
MRHIALAALVTACISSYATCAWGADAFTWINANDNNPILNEVKSAFAAELLPDNPEKVKPVVPYYYKYISKIGAFRNSRLVLIGYREREGDKPEYDYFKVFSYDSVRHIKAEVEPKDYYYRWSLVTETTFEPSATPDIVFKFFDCLECESTELLSSFRFDEKENVWKKRMWPENDSDLMIDSARQYGSEDNWIYDCLYKVADFNSDTFADIAIRCRETGEITHKVKDELLLYTIQNVIAKRIKIEDKTTYSKINSALCSGQSSPLCKKK